ncbi:MAG: RidA family protein [Gammaproteobacteria bacterium]|nr:RidA family protein [Gammaproteobacteria bacterium]
MTIQTVSTGGRFEAIGAYSRAKRIGPFIYVAGTTAIEPSGKLHAPNDTYAQSMYIFDRIRDVLLELGAEMKHVVRTRAFMTNMKTAGEFVRAHGEVFQGINPVTSGVEAGLTTPGMMIEIEVDAVIHDESGAIQL